MPKVIAWQHIEGSKYLPQWVLDGGITLEDLAERETAHGSGEFYRPLPHDFWLVKVEGGINVLSPEQFEAEGLEAVSDA